MLFKNVAPVIWTFDSPVWRQTECHCLCYICVYGVFFLLLLLIIYLMAMTYVKNFLSIFFLFQVQFFLIMVHWLALLFQSSCGYPKFPVAIMVPQNLFMLALFGDFYYKTYIREKKSSGKKRHDGDTKKKDDNDDNNNSAPIECTNNGAIKTMANGNGIICRNNVNNYNSSGTTVNGIPSS